MQVITGVQTPEEKCLEAVLNKAGLPSNIMGAEIIIHCEDGTILRSTVEAITLLENNEMDISLAEGDLLEILYHRGESICYGVLKMHDIDKGKPVVRLIFPKTEISVVTLH